jgi:DNA-binding LacI/PurR family transcriptional regulator/DNA-binding transcriptional regulator YhcF (GntR family)
MKGLNVFMKKPGSARPKVANGDGSVPQPPVEINRYLYEKIYAELKEEILSGKYKKGDWFPPERILKNRFNTTHLTVRNALAKLVLDGYIERYSGKGTIVLYSRSRSPQTRRLLRFTRAHIIVEKIDAANAILLESLEEGLRRLSIPARFSCHHGDTLLEGSLYRMASEEETLIILEPACSEASILHSVDPLRNTIVVRGSDDRFAGPQIVTDDQSGAREAVRYLLSLGYRAIALLCSSLLISWERQRLGYEEELALQGIPLDRTLIVNGTPGTEGGTASCRRILATHKDCRAFLCGSDEAAAGAIAFLRQQGRAAGTDCVVIGWGNTPLAEAIGLTTVDPGISRLGEQVMATVVEAMARGAFPEGIFTVAPELRLRSSCARAPAAT